MIYEKIVQTIERFNKKNNRDIKARPIRIDRNIAPHSYTISEEILKAIENCGLIIADLSSGNKNVYHEIGFTMGLSRAKNIEPPIILVYKSSTIHNKKEYKLSEDDFVGFNLRGISQLRFTDYSQLEENLYRRLGAYFEE